MIRLSEGHSLLFLFFFLKSVIPRLTFYKLVQFKNGMLCFDFFFFDFHLNKVFYKVSISPSNSSFHYKAVRNYDKVLQCQRKTGRWSQGSIFQLIDSSNAQHVFVIE